MQRRETSVPPVWSFAPYVTVSAIHVILLALQSDAAAPTKLLLMPLLAVPVIVCARHIVERRAVALILSALLFSWLGDSAGMFFPAAPELPLMLAFFALAHLAYITLFLRHLSRRRLPWWALVYALWWVGMLVGLGPHTGDLFFAVAAYGVVLAATATLSTRCHPIVALGGAFFLASDTILAFRLFLPDDLPTWSSPAVMATYTLGQGLIVLGALLTLRKRST